MMRCKKILRKKIFLNCVRPQKRKKAKFDEKEEPFQKVPIKLFTIPLTLPNKTFLSDKLIARLV
jgi:hypothetical protein